MNYKALTKQPLCKYISAFKKYLIFVGIYVGICVGMQVDWSRQTVNLLPQGKLVGLNPTRHTKLWGFGLTGKTLRHLETTVRFCQIPLRNLFSDIFRVYFWYGSRGNYDCIGQ